MKKSIDMLQGSIVNKVLLFALPLAFTGMLQQLFNAADVAIVGRFVSKQAMAAVGSNASIIGLMVNLFIGISIGANVVISIATGKKDREGISRCVHTSVLFALLGGGLIIVIGELVAEPLLNLMGVPAEIFEMALAYIRIYILGMPVIFLYNYESAIFRSQGDTRTPLIVLAVAGVSNVIMNLFFVCVIGMRADGVALATVLSNVISSGLLFVLLCRRKDMIKLQPAKIRLHGSVLKQMIKIGLPAGLQSMVFSISNMCLQSAINSLGADVVAASSAAFNIEILIFYLVNSFGQASTTFVGQNYGANNVPRCRKITRRILVLDVCVATGAALILLSAGKILLSVFCTEQAIIDIGFTRLCYILLGEALCAIMEVMSGAMRGYGYSLVPAVATFIGVCGIRITWVYTVFKAVPAFSMIMAVYPVSWAATAIVLVIAYLMFMKSLERGDYK